MSMPVLATKLYVPQPRPGAVLRPRLIDRLSEGLASGCKLTLVSASAGFGKTTLISEWIAHCGRPAAWLSLDDGDSDFTRFLTCLVAALQTIFQRNVDGVAGKLGAGVLGALQSPQPPSIESMLTTLLNEIDTVTGKFILVLDDYHRVDSKTADNALAFLLEHLPPQMHLVITTREDPQFPLARLRARGQLTELRAAELRFTPAEAAEFLNQAMDLQLSAEDVVALEARTEGWITGLQLAALALQGLGSALGHPDKSRFVESFTGSHRFVLDYLVEEVLQRQPEPVRNFLLQTAILERLSGPLCDAVTRGTGSAGMLEILERANLFIVPLDNQREWYRYHHLFAEVLLAHARAEPPGQIPLWGRRASVWCEQNNLPAEAIQYALDGRDFERAAGLIEKLYPAMDASFQSATWLGWVRKLPEDVVRRWPVLGVDYAWSLVDRGEYEASLISLRDAEQRLKDPANGMSVADEGQFSSLPAKIALIHAGCAQIQGDIEGTVKFAELALQLSPDEDSYTHVMAAVTLGMAYWSHGDLLGAQRALTVWINYCLKAGKISFAVVSGGYLAGIIATLGRLREAEKIYKQSIELASTHHQSVRHVIAGLHLGLGLLYFEQGNQRSASELLRACGELGEQALPDWPWRWRLAQARLREAEGDLETALELLDEARRLYVRTTEPDVQPINALRARVLLRHGRLGDALAWARERGLSAHDSLSYLGEYEHVTFARILIARRTTDPQADSIDDAIDSLQRLLQAAEAGQRIGSVMEILVTLALALQARGDVAQALVPMERALSMAEPEGYVRMFVDEGAPMAHLLSECAGRGILPGYAGRLIAAFQAEPKTGKEKPDLPNAQRLIEPLSQRELEVLALMAQGHSNRGIGERLFLAVSTVKGYNQKLFDKLQVQSRTEAIARARALGLL